MWLANRIAFESVANKTNILIPHTARWLMCTLGGDGWLAGVHALGRMQLIIIIFITNSIECGGGARLQ